MGWVHHSFPHPEQSTEEGIVGLGGVLNTDILLSAYSQGIFPWPHDRHLLWFSPPQRGVLFFDQLHISQSFKKFLKHNPFQLTKNQNFSLVIEECKNKPRPGQHGTWITEDMQRAYIELHKSGWAHSIEVWENHKLVGGIYGIQIGKYFSAESMFFHATGASKFAFLQLVNDLKAQGITWLDIQMVTDVTKSFGGCYIERKEFLKLLKSAMKEFYELSQK